MGLKETYESWVFRPIAGVGANATPVKQSEGDVSVNFLQDTYQPRKEVNRAPGDTVVTQATEDNATAGIFKQEALGYYSTLIGSTLKTYKSRVVHKYNNTNARYLESTQVRNTPGALYINLND
jgi:hypothetical protein